MTWDKTICWFCERRPATSDASFQQYLQKTFKYEVGYQGPYVRLLEKTLSDQALIPRCNECMAIHKIDTSSKWRDFWYKKLPNFLWEHWAWVWIPGGWIIAGAINVGGVTGGLLVLGLGLIYGWRLLDNRANEGWYREQPARKAGIKPLSMTGDCPEVQEKRRQLDLRGMVP